MECLGSIPDEKTRGRKRVTSIFRLFSRTSFVFLIWRCSEATETETAWWSTTWRKSLWLRHWGYCVTKTLKTSWVPPSAWEQKFTAASFKQVSVCCQGIYKLLVLLTVQKRGSQIAVIRIAIQEIGQQRSSKWLFPSLDWGRGTAGSRSEVREKDIVTNLVCSVYRKPCFQTQNDVHIL